MAIPHFDKVMENNVKKKFKFLQLFGRLNELVGQKEHKTQQVFLPKSKIYYHNFDNYFFY